jgi:hypothetical protein
MLASVGKGGFAKCYRLMDTDTNEEWACKVVAKASLTKQRHKAKVRYAANFTCVFTCVVVMYELCVCVFCCVHAYSSCQEKQALMCM